MGQPNSACRRSKQHRCKLSCNGMTKPIPSPVKDQAEATCQPTVSLTSRLMNIVLRLIGVLFSWFLHPRLQLAASVTGILAQATTGFSVGIFLIAQTTA